MVRCRWIYATALLALLAPHAHAAWPHARHDGDASNRVEGSGALSRAPGHEPGFEQIVDVRERQLDAGRLWDVDGDGQPEYLAVLHGSAVALDLETGAERWRSPPRGIDGLAAIGDFDGDGTPELVATDAGVGGGLYIVDLQTGALRGGWTALEERSGIDAAELSVADVDDDGLDELIVPASLFGLAQLWVLDFGAGLDAPQVQTLSFDGYANVTPARVGRFVPGGELAIVVDQGPEQRTFVRCDGGSWCPATAFAGVHPSFAFGRTHIVDLDGDGLDEILNVASNPSFSRAVSVLDVADGLATAQTSSLLKWAWRHDAAVPTTLLQTPAQVPVDLDDDGQLEVVVSVVNDLGVEVDAAGAPANDGVDRPGAISTLVLDGSTGAVEQVIDDVFAYGWADLDGNGRAELIVSPTVGWHHESSLRGLELSCGAGCAMTRWQVDDARVHRYLDELDGTGLPDAALRQVLVGGQDPAIVVHRGQEQLGLLRGAQGSVAMVEALAVTPDAVVHGGDADWVVVADRDTVQLLDASLTPVAAPVQMPRRGAGQWLAAPLVDGGRMALSFEGRLLLDDEVSLLPRVALIADFGNDGGAEVVHFRNPHDGLGPGFEIRVDRVQPDGAGGLQPVWSRRSHEDPQLDGYVVGGALHFQLGDFDGQGVRDLVLPARRGSEWNYLVFDGDTGALDAVLQPGGTPSTYSPALVGDLVLDVPVDDVLMHGTSVLALLTIEALGPVQTVVPDFYQSVGLNADLDGDGQPEVVGTLSATIDNQMEARRSTGALDLVWGPRALGRPSGNANVLAVGDLDAAPGLDPVYVDGDGGVTIYSGTTGAVVEGFPVYMHAGGLSATPATDAAVASGVIVLDVDGDGAEEVVAGTAEGRVYAINAAFDDPQRGQLEWTMEIGAAVVQLAAADVDADGALEILVANDRGEGLVLDDLGVTIAIDPVTGCVGPGPHQVQGDAAGVARVELWLNGVPMGAPVAVSGGQWTHTIELQSAGEYQLEARGLDDAGVARILATASLVVEAECPDVPEPDPLPPDDDVDPDVIPPSDDGGLIDRGCLCGTGGSDFPLGIAMFVLLAVRPRRRRG